MSDIEPEAKKAKPSAEERRTFTYTKRDYVSDRVLLVDNSVFYVHSQTLIEHSEYFRAMFTSDFIEKDKHEIEIKGVEEGEMRMFLTALFEPEKIGFEEDDLPLFCKLFSFFQSTGYLVYLLKEKGIFKVFEKFTARNLLELGVEYGIPEMKDAVESSLISRFVTRFPLTTKSLQTKAIDFAFDDYIINALDFLTEFNLQKLKEKVEALLSCDYNRNKRHLIAIERQYVELMSKYQLEELKKDIERYAIFLFNKNQTNSKEILYRYLKKAEPVKMDNLKAAIENYYINLYRVKHEDQKEVYRLLDAAQTYELVNFLNHMETMLIAELEMDKSFNKFFIIGHAAAKWMPKLKEAIENLIVNKLQNGEEVDSKFVDLCCYYASNHSTDKLKEDIEEFLMNMFKNGREIESRTIKICSRYSVKHNKDDMKTAMEEYLLSEFENNRSLKYLAFAFSPLDGIGSVKDGKDVDPGNFFNKFRDTMMKFLKTVTLDDPVMKDGYANIMALNSSYKNRVLEAMLRNPDADT